MQLVWARGTTKEHLTITEDPWRPTQNSLVTQFWSQPSR